MRVLAPGATALWGQVPGGQTGEGEQRGNRTVPGHGAEILLDENSYYQ